MGQVALPPALLQISVNAQRGGVATRRSPRSLLWSAETMQQNHQRLGSAANVVVVFPGASRDSVASAIAAAVVGMRPTPTVRLGDGLGGQ